MDNEAILRDMMGADYPLEKMCVVYFSPTYMEHGPYRLLSPSL